MDDLLTEFLGETSESLGQLDSELVRLEQNPDDPSLLRSIFRIVHTIKGTCGFLGLPRLERLAHAAENVLGQVRDGALTVTPEAVTVILAALDRIKEILAALAETKAEPQGTDDDLIARLAGLMPDNEGTPVSAGVIPSELPPTAPAETALLQPEKREAAPAQAAATTERGHETDLGAQTIRLNVNLLEDLMTTVSELVLTRNQLMQTLRMQKDTTFAAPLQRLSQVTTELQEGVMRTRMQPISNAWAKLPRLVRDLAHDLGKKLELRMLGADTELDRQVLEMVKDPLTHMVRNCADHGIETPADRLIGGKPEHGTITLNAYHVGGHIVVEIGDDGRGISLEKIRAKALASGLASEVELDTMSGQQLHQFIFRPGFSTAAKVTNVSGRGVGLDVVRTNIEKIGGTVELKSEVGKGSTFVIKIPLTLAIVSTLIVECAGQRFAIPQINVIELVRAAANSEHRIENLHNAPVLRLRERILPLVSLQALLGVPPNEKPASEVFVIVTQVGAQSFGIIVDRVFDTEEIVVKPVSPALRDLPIYSGNTILGDGSVIMILDPNGIAAEAGVDAEHAETGTQAAAAEASRAALETVILFRAAGPEPKAVPLELVSRLEAIDRKQIEQSNGRLVVQYRGTLMPLVSMGNITADTLKPRQPVLVFTEGDHCAGLLVDEIIDIIETHYTIELKSDQPGVIGSAVIAGKATELINIGHYMSQAPGSWFHVETEVDFGAASQKKRILLVDDSAFFRNMMQPMLVTAGYDVIATDSAEKALKLCEDGDCFDLILSDIEMPVLDGFGFAEKVRGIETAQDTPMIALTAHASQRDRERTRASGFAHHVPKFDQRGLLTAIKETVASERGAA